MDMRFDHGAARSGNPSAGGSDFRGRRRSAVTQRDLFRPSKTPWNARRIIGAKPPLKPKHVWAIRQQLKSAHRTRDLALFNCAIDAKLRGSDLVKLRLSDVAPGGSLRQRATVIQQKTGRPVPFEITDPTREALSVWLIARGSRPDDWLFPSRSRPGDHITTRQYARLVDHWVAMIDLDPRSFGTTAFEEQRSRWSIKRPATSACANYFWAIGNWKALSGISGSRLTMRSRFQSRLSFSSLLYFDCISEWLGHRPPWARPMPNN